MNKPMIKLDPKTSVLLFKCINWLQMGRPPLMLTPKSCPEVEILGGGLCEAGPNGGSRRAEPQAIFSDLTQKWLIFRAFWVYFSKLFSWAGKIL